MKARLALLFMLLCGLAGSVTSTWLEHRAAASRNSAGTYSLPAGNPVVSGTTVSSTWANTTLNDIGTELTNSLDRAGRGAMTGALQLSTGSSSFPALTWSAEPSSGLYKKGTNDFAFQIAANSIQEWLTAGTSVTGTLTASGDITSTAGGVLAVSGVLVDSGGNNNGSFVQASLIQALKFGGTTSGEGIISKRNVGTGQNGLDFFTVTTDRMGLNSGGVYIPGQLAATPGTAISGSYGGSFNITFGSIGAGANGTSSQTVTGAAVGGVCEVSTDGNIGNAVVSCYVSAANTVVVKVAAIGAVNLSAGNYRVRVWNP